VGPNWQNEPKIASVFNGRCRVSFHCWRELANNHDVIVSKETGFLKGVALHAVDALGLVHALILRLQALALPFQTLVFSGH
jgi:hypothetical protein